MKRAFFLLNILLYSFSFAVAQRTEVLLCDDWLFAKGDNPGAERADYDDSAWQRVSIPHDWAISGPFSRDNDLQNVAVSQNFETQASVKTGRTGGLPYVGVGWYRCEFAADAQKEVSLVFDGAMSEPRVWVNGQEVAHWCYGYNAFHCDISSALRKDGKPNVLAVRLENKPQSSRWYPGAGLYRNVHLVSTSKIHVPVWGTRLTTPRVETDSATVCLQTEILGADTCLLTVETDILNARGSCVAKARDIRRMNADSLLTQRFTVKNPSLWSPETPHLYTAVTRIYASGRLQDTYSTRFGIRSIAFVPEKGFLLNGVQRKFRGVCNHHDLGPLGTAVNESALRHRLTMLKDMGCDAVRTAHNMPSPELVALCDEMGLMMMVETFDEWDVAKCANGYHRFFNEWAERDLVNVVRHFRNAPSVVMWCIGNEVPTQCSAGGYAVAKRLQDICHREDPTRPVTCGMDQVSCVLSGGFAALLDVPGLNYRTHRYEEAYKRLPQGFILGSETASTVSSRGVYHFPVERKADARTPDHQSSSYDLEYCSWSNIPDMDFALADDYPWTLGQFVWTGFDYLGEPSPYDTDAWPNHSSLFGIIDLASIPKDRYWLYRSVWNKDAHTLHVLPHWTWEGREGKTTPVFVYTSYPEAELFVNGKSQGRRHKLSREEARTPEERYRLMWRDVVYEPGELLVVAYDTAGRETERRSVHTAGAPHRLVITPSGEETLRADGKSVAYFTVSAVDADGNPCPTFSGEVDIKVSGAARYRAAANGDPTCLTPFHSPRMAAFSGSLTVILQADTRPGKARLEVSALGLKPARRSVKVKKP